MAECWKREGHKVQFLFGTRIFVPADICILHVDLSIVPAKYVEFAHRYPVVINGSITDISKRSFSQNLVKLEDNYKGQVIVKTNLNFAGWPEKVATLNTASLVTIKALHRIGVKFDTFVNHSDYRVYDQITSVPEKFISNPYFIVEKFLPERINGHYYVNFYKFFGNVHQGIKACSRHAVVTGETEISREPIDPHPEIIHIRKEKKLDFGKIDYCINNNKIVLIDINKTVGMQAGSNSPEFLALARQCAKGLYDYF